MELALVTAIGEMVLKYGVPAALQIMKEWEVIEPTLEDIAALRERVPRPGTYFEKSEESKTQI